MSGSGDRLRADMANLLEAAGRELGQTLEFDEREADILGRACAAADRADVVQALFDAEQAGDASAPLLLKMSAELRMLDRQVVDLVARLEPGPGVARSNRHVRAARARWSGAGA